MRIETKEKGLSSPQEKSFGKKSNHIIQQKKEKYKPEEKWIDIEGFENKYQVSNLGQIRKIHIICPRISKRGYKQVTLEGNHYYIHRLVATHFLEKIDGKYEVNHLDGNPSNNNADNLEWCTHQENVQYSYDKLGRKIFGKKGFENSCSKAVGQFDLNGNLIKVWGSQMEIERVLGIRHSNISMACSGKRGHHKAHNYIWKWLN